MPANDEVHELRDAVKLAKIDFIEISCSQPGADHRLDEEFEDLDEGEANIQFGQDLSPDGNVRHRGRVRALGKGGRQIFIEVGAGYTWISKRDFDSDAYDRFLQEYGIDLLLPYLREGVASFSARLGMTTGMLPILDKSELELTDGALSST